MKLIILNNNLHNNYHKNFVNKINKNTQYMNKR